MQSCLPGKSAQSQSFRPLQIKKLVDDTCPSVDLKLVSTVADIFVNRGKAEADGHDQRGTVRVIPKPSAELPERFPSVVQDWEGAIRDARRRKSTKAITRFSPIREDDELLSGWKSSPVPHEFDITGRPENVDPPASSGVAIADTPPFPGSEELGDSPSPTARESTPHASFGSNLYRQASAEPTNGNSQQVSSSFPESGNSVTTGMPASHKRKRTPEQDPASHQARRRSHTPQRMAPVSAQVMHEPHSPSLNNENASRKRKQTPEPDRPAKQPRVETNGSPQKSPTPTSKSPARRRIPTFSSPRRRISISEESRHSSEHGLGLGITRSPHNNRKRTGELSSSQAPIKGPLFPSSALTSSHPPSSALKKDSNSALTKPHKRASVSFADLEDEHHDVTPKQSQRAPPSSQVSEMVFPPGFSQEQIEEFQRQAERRLAEREQKPDKAKQAREKPAKEKQTKEKLAKEKLTKEKLAKEKRAKEKQAKEKQAKEKHTKEKLADEPSGKPRASTDIYRNSDESKSHDSRQSPLLQISGIDKQPRGTQKSKGRRSRRLRTNEKSPQKPHEEEVSYSQLEPSLPVPETTVARRIPENEDQALSNTSNPSIDGDTSIRRQSVSSTSTRQSGSLPARETSKSPNKHRKELTDAARTLTPASASLGRSQSRSASLSHSLKSHDPQEKQATAESPSVKKEADSDTEDSLSSQGFSEPAMDLDNVEEQNGENDGEMELDNVEEQTSDDEYSSSQSNSSSDSGETEPDDEDSQYADRQHELKAQDSHAGGNQKEAHKPTLENDSHLSDSEVSTGSEDGQDDEQEIDGHVQEHNVSHDEEQADVRNPETIEVLSDSGESSESEPDEDLEDNAEGEIQEHPVNGDHNSPHAPMPGSVSDPRELDNFNGPENGQNVEEDIGTVPDHPDREHPSQVNGHAPVEPNETTDDSSEESDDDSDESDSLALPKRPSTKPQIPAGSVSSMPAKPQPPTSTGMPVLQRTTLKGLLKAQKEESQRRGQQHQETRPQRPLAASRGDVYDVPSSRESKSSSDTESEGGDIPHGGRGLLNKLRMPWSRG